MLPLDVTDEAQIASAFEATREHFGRLDVVVNNAGYGIQSEIEGTPDSEARRMMETLFWGPVHVTQLVILTPYFLLYSLTSVCVGHPIHA